MSVHQTSAYRMDSDWCEKKLLGKGGYGKVYLMENTKTNDSVACKVMNLDPQCSNEADIINEICIHKMLDHTNVVTYKGHQKVHGHYQLIMEYANGGTLFNRIDGDILSEEQCRGYFQQLITGVEYLHSVNVVHRDIKPGNLLLDDKNQLKITDFGFSTLMRCNGKNVALYRQCGTTKYMAPEMFDEQKYRGQPVDIWACAVVLAMMCTGNLYIWDNATNECEEYKEFHDCQLQNKEWEGLSPLLLDLLYKMLKQDPKERLTIAGIKKHPWYTGEKEQQVMKHPQDEAGTSLGTQSVPKPKTGVKRCHPGSSSGPPKKKAALSGAA